MNLAAETRDLLEQFFREYLADENFVLPKANFALGRIARLAVRILNIQGITVGGLVFIAPALLGGDADRRTLPRDLVVHEIAHVVQYRRHGFFGFLLRYFADYWRNLRAQKSWSLEARHAAYLAIPFEIEARQTAYDFMRWFAKRRESR
jgi:hypothetical protein